MASAFKSAVPALATGAAGFAAFLMINRTEKSRLVQAFSGGEINEKSGEPSNARRLVKSITGTIATMDPGLSPAWNMGGPSGHASIGSLGNPQKRPITVWHDGREMMVVSSLSQDQMGGS